MLICHGEVWSVVYCQDLTLKLTVTLLYAIVELFALRASRMWALFCGLNAGTLERATFYLFDELVRCSAHGHSFTRL